MAIINNLNKIDMKEKWKNCLKILIKNCRIRTTYLKIIEKLEMYD